MASARDPLLDVKNAEPPNLGCDYLPDIKWNCFQIKTLRDVISIQAKSVGDLQIVLINTTDQVSDELRSHYTAER